MEDKQAEETGFNLALAYFASNILELDDYATELQDFLVDSAFPMQVTSWYQAYVTFNENKLSATAVPVGKAYDRSDAESSETQQTVVSMKIENDNKASAITTAPFNDISGLSHKLDGRAS